MEFLKPSLIEYSLKRVWTVVGVAVVALAAATVALQSLGFAPAMKVVP